MPDVIDSSGSLSLEITVTAGSSSVFSTDEVFSCVSVSKVPTSVFISGSFVVWLHEVKNAVIKARRNEISTFLFFILSPFLFIKFFFGKALLMCRL